MNLENKINGIFLECIDMYLNFISSKNIISSNEIEELRIYLNEIPIKTNYNHTEYASFTSAGEIQFFNVSPHIFNSDNGVKSIDEENFKRIVLHEITHAVSYKYSGRGRLFRFEEGVADYISDKIYNDFKGVDSVRKTSYIVSGMFAKSLAALSNDELIYSYVFEGKTNKNDYFESEFYKKLVKYIGKENSDLFLKVDHNTTSLHFMSKHEKQMLKKINNELVLNTILDLGIINISNNELLQECIYESLIKNGEKNFDIIKSKYNNLPNDFLSKYKIRFSEIGIKSSFLKNNLTVDKNKSLEDMKFIADSFTNEVMPFVKEYVDIKYKTQHILNMLIIYKNYAELLDLGNLEKMQIHSFLITIDFMNGDNNELEEFINTNLINFDIDQNSLLYNSYVEMIKYNLELFNNKQNEEIFKIISNSLEQNIYNYINLKYYSEELIEGKIDRKDYIDFYIKIYQKSFKDNNCCSNYLFIYFTQNLLSNDLLNKSNMNIDDVLKEFDEFESIYSDLNYIGRPIFKEKIAQLIFEKNIDVKLFFEVLNKVDLEIFNEDLLNDSLLKMIEQSEDFDIETMELIVNSVNNEVFRKNNLGLSFTIGGIRKDNKFINVLKEKCVVKLVDDYVDNKDNNNEIIASQNFYDFLESSFSEEFVASEKKLLLYELSLIKDKYPNVSEFINKVNDGKIFSPKTIAYGYNLSDKDTILFCLKAYSNTPYLLNKYINLYIYKVPRTFMPGELLDAINNYELCVDIPTLSNMVKENLEENLKLFDAFDGVANSNLFYGYNKLLKKNNLNLYLNDNQMYKLIYNSMKCYLMSKNSNEVLEYCNVLLKFKDNYSGIINSDTMDIINNVLSELNENENNYHKV